MYEHVWLGVPADWGHLICTFALRKSIKIKVIMEKSKTKICEISMRKTKTKLKIKIKIEGSKFCK